MRLVIDLQCAQGSNRKRGIGRYSISLTRALARLREDNEIVVVLSSLFPSQLEEVRQALSEVLPPAAIRVMHLPCRVADADPACDARRQAAELVREQFLNSLNPDVILIASLFEGLGDDLVTSTGNFASRSLTATILYDLIPLINRDIYLANPTVSRWYERKLAHLRRSDLLLAISKSSREEALDWLGVSPAQVVNISSAADDHFYPAPVSTAELAVLQRKLGLTRPFIMYTGGIDHRKNVERLIEAFAALPKPLRLAHQLAIVCSIEASDKARLKKLAAYSGLGPDELVLTGYISENDLITCYRLCKLFVFPSWHEGFGLPILEAMKCGRAVIASNRSSLIEVVGSQEALFDPFDVDAIRDAIERALTDDAFRSELEKHSLSRAEHFSWDKTALIAWDALKKAHQLRADLLNQQRVMGCRPRLAYLSPLPPERSGISDYSAELIPELARHYEIVVVTAQEQVSDVSILANHLIRSVEWFREHAAEFDRIVYHFGNSHFHSSYFDLLRDFPGAVVLHDFYLSGIIAQREVTGGDPGGWARELFDGNGWPAVVHRFKAVDTADVVWAYPCNLRVLQDALGVIVHAEFSRHLARRFYGGEAGQDWYHIPLLRQPIITTDRKAARSALNLSETDFVVCSFGLLGPMKMNDRLLSAWFQSELAKNHNCHLVFVGENSPGFYGTGLVNAIGQGEAAGRVDITGWTDTATYKLWLSAADVAVQLRTLSRGETSAAVLDCMNAGLPTVVNANGSMAELPHDCVWPMAEDFTDDDLILALSSLYRDASRRSEMACRSRAHIKSHHNPRRCAEAYARAIEDMYAKSDSGADGLARALVVRGQNLTSADWQLLIKAMSRNAVWPLRKRRLLVDISELVQRDYRSGIQRVVRSILMRWLSTPPGGFIVEPVYATVDEAGYRYARRFTSKILDIWPSWSEEDVVEPCRGDIFLGLDLQPHVVPRQSEILNEWRQMGVIVRFVIYDLLPVFSPNFFLPGARDNHQTWLRTISQFDGVICISRAVAEEFTVWLDHYGPPRAVPLELDWFHLGGDREIEQNESGVPETAEAVLQILRAVPSFLSVSTIEPRKGFAQTLDAMEILWAKGVNVNFVIVGKSGWMMDEFVSRLRRHSELGRRLHWLEGIADAYLYSVYGACRCLIAASEGEGFGLPLIESAHHNLPVLARDLPVFREIAGDAATYFPNTRQPEPLAAAILEVLCSSVPAADTPTFSWLTWNESADALLGCLLRTNEPYRRWMPDGALRFWGSDSRVRTTFGVPDGRSIRTAGQAGYLVSGPLMSLSAGEWAIKARGEAITLDGSEEIDVVSGEGRNSHIHSKLIKRDGAWILEASFFLDEDVDDFEVRILVSKNSDISLDIIEVRVDNTSSRRIDQV